MAGLQRVTGIVDGVELGYADKTKQSISCVGIISNLTASDSKADVDIYFHKFSGIESQTQEGQVAILVIKKDIKPLDNWWGSLRGKL